MRWKVTVVLVTLTAAIYGQCLGFSWLFWDDTTHIAENPLLNPVSVNKLLELWRHPYFNLYVPVTYTIWSLLGMLSQALGGALHPGLYHTLNLVFHALNGWLVYQLLDRLLLSVGSTSRPSRQPLPEERPLPPAAFGAAMFLVHPIQVEAVAWISSFRDVLATTFGLAALLCICPRPVNGAEVESRRPGPAVAPTPHRWAAAAILVALGFLSKPVLAVWPLVAGLTLGLIREAPARRWLPWLAAIAALILPAVVLTKELQRDDVMNFVTPWLWRPVVALDALAFYFGKVLWPFDLAPDYGRSPEWLLSDASTARYWTWAVTLLLLPLALRGRTKRPVAWAGFLIFVAALLPVLGFVPFSFQGFSTVADRYLYFPMVGAALCASALASDWIKARPRLRHGLWGLVLGLAALSAHQTRHWKDNLSFYRFTIHRNPQSYMGHNGLSKTLTQMGLYEEALVHAREGLKLKPGNPVSLNNVGHILYEMKRYEESVRYYEQTFRDHKPRGNNQSVFALMHTNAGAALIHLRRFPEAVRHLNEAIALDPKNAMAHHNIGAIFLMQGRYRESLPWLEKSVELAPFNGLHRQNHQRALEGLRKSGP